MYDHEAGLKVHTASKVKGIGVNHGRNMKQQASWTIIDEVLIVRITRTLGKGSEPVIPIVGIQPAEHIIEPLGEKFVHIVNIREGGVDTGNVKNQNEGQNSYENAQTDFLPPLTVELKIIHDGNADSACYRWFIIGLGW
jgi:hypothetical protein